MWKPTAQEGLWFHGGNLALSRYYSLYLALQLKARMEGIPTPVYRRAEVNHTNSLASCRGAYDLANVVRERVVQLNSRSINKLGSVASTPTGVDLRA